MRWEKATVKQMEKHLAKVKQKVIKTVKQTD